LLSVLAAVVWLPSLPSLVVPLAELLLDEPQAAIAMAKIATQPMAAPIRKMAGFLITSLLALVVPW